VINLDELFDFFKNKRVLVTGHTGFKGSWLTLVLRKMGAEVLGYALAPEESHNHFTLLGLESEIQHCVGDIRDAEKLAKFCLDFQPEIVLHLAAQALVKKSYLNPTETYSTNVMGSLNLLEAVRLCPSIKSLVYVTSDKCYENLEWPWGYRENDRLGGADPYSSSKACAEILFSSFARSFFTERNNFSAASVRAGNVIGGGDWSTDRIIPDCVRAAESNSALILRSPNATRPWQHVLEPISGYLKLAMMLYKEPKKFEGSWNFGPSSHEIRTVLDVSQAVINVLGSGTIKIEENFSNLHEAKLLQLNCDRSNHILGWYPRWDVDTTIEKTGVWYKSFMGGKSTKETTLNQVEEFFEVQK
jgi:CDP-glucose 4,6-dehydratase